MGLLARSAPTSRALLARSLPEEKTRNIFFVEEQLRVSEEKMMEVRMRSKLSGSSGEVFRCSSAAPVIQQTEPRSSE